MPSRVSSSKLRYRPVTTADLPQVEKMCANIWDGHDYLPGTIREWLKKPDLHRVEGVDMDDQLVALGSLALVEDEPRRVAVFEGLRVDPDYGGRGLGTAMEVYMIEQAARKWRPKAQDSERTDPITLIRLVTFEKAVWPETRAPNKIAETAGCKRVLSMAAVFPDAEAIKYAFEQVSSLRETFTLAPGTTEDLLAMKDTIPLFVYDWKVLSNTKHALARFVAKQDKFQLLFGGDSGARVASSFSVANFTQVVKGVQLNLTVFTDSLAVLMAHIKQQQEWGKVVSGDDSMLLRLFVYGGLTKEQLDKVKFGDGGALIVWEREL